MTFTPEILGDTFSSSILTQFFEFLILLIGKTMIGQPAAHLGWMDIFVFTGYKYVGVAINMLVGIFFGAFFYNVVLAYTALCSSFMLFKTLQCGIPSPGPHQGGRKRRLYFLIGVSALEALIMWYLGYNNDMSKDVPTFFKYIYGDSPIDGN